MELQKILDYMYDVYKIVDDKKIYIVTKSLSERSSEQSSEQSSEPGAQMVIVLKKYSPYVDNKIIFNIQSNDTDYIFNMFDRTIGLHILCLILNSIDGDENHLEIDGLRTTGVLKIQRAHIAEFIEYSVKTVYKIWNRIYEICPICFLDSKNDSTDLHQKKKTLEIEPCEQCLPDSFGIIYDNIIMDTYNKDPNLFKLLLYTSLKAIDTVNRFNPVPMYCKSKKYENDQLGPEAVSRDFDYYLKSMLTPGTTDRDLYKKINIKEYQFLKHIIISNNTRLNYFDNSSPGLIARDIDIWKRGESIVFTIDHPTDIQNRFDSDISVAHMFHGSSLSNWYSIMRNGLKNYSGTDMMTNGQAHGAGIYLGTNMATSHSYCRGVGSEYRIMGIVQVLDSARYKKTNNIYVVPDESNILLKYLVLIKNNVASLSAMEKYFTVDLPLAIKTSVIDAAIIRNKRIEKECGEFKKIAKKLQSVHKNITLQVNEPLFVRTRDIDNEKPADNRQNDSNILDVTWEIKLNIKNNIIDILVTYPRMFPSVSCSIQCNSIDSIDHVPMMQKIIEKPNKYQYNEPVLKNHNEWRSNIKIHRVIEQMIINIDESYYFYPR